MFFRMLTIWSCLAVASTALLSRAPWTKTVAAIRNTINASDARRVLNPNSSPRPPRSSKTIARVSHSAGAGQPSLPRKPVMPANPVILLNADRMKMREIRRRDSG